MMGGFSRNRPKRLAEKLLQIRQRLDYSQSKMAEVLSDKIASVVKQNISSFERDIREPSLMILLRYARLAKVSSDVLIDDDLDLPKKFS